MTNQNYDYYANVVIFIIIIVIIIICYYYLLYIQYTITLWFPCLDGLIQTRGNVARVKKSRARVILRAFLNSSNFPKCLDQAIQNTETIK